MFVSIICEDIRREIPPPKKTWLLAPLLSYMNMKVIAKYTSFDKYCILEVLFL